MKFKEYPYEHIELEDAKAELKQIQEEIQNAESYEALLDAVRHLNTANSRFSTMSNLASIRHTINTRDEYYTQENEYLEQAEPVLQEERIRAMDLILESPYIEQLKAELPETWFLQAEMDKKAFSPEIIADLQEESKLANQYQALVASAQIEFDGKTYTLAGLEEKMEDPDRETRKRAYKAYWGWFTDHEKEIGSIYDRMVKVRTAMAKKLGFENYIPLGYLRMHRMDYDQNDVENYRRQILKDIVPLAQDLYAEQKERLGYDELHVWDEKTEFLDGNPTPKHTEPEMVERALKMYKELSPETGEFFQFMTDHELLDLQSKPGKAAGGYCTFIPDFKSPFIFANFSNTQHDAEVLTHEAGHAFQVYSSQDIFPLDSVWPTYESCEIHSMSMEFFTYPWMPSFFEDETDKYYHSHLGGTIKFLPYGVTVDHFQHEVYAHPEWSHEERMAAWRELEKMYLPHKNYEEIDVLERGGWWMRQLHIFMDPFYYIDYTLAQVCALQFWNRLQKQDPAAFEDYKKLCKVGGKLPFRKLVKLAGLNVPFEEGCLSETAQNVRNWYQEHPYKEPQA